MVHVSKPFEIFTVTNMLGILFFLLKIISRKILTKGSQNERLLSGIIGPVTNIIDKVVLDKDEAARLAHEISTMADRHAQELALA